MGRVVSKAPPLNFSSTKQGSEARGTAVVGPASIHGGSGASAGMMAIRIGANSVEAIGMAQSKLESEQVLGYV